MSVFWVEPDSLCFVLFCFIYIFMVEDLRAILATWKWVRIILSAPLFCCSTCIYYIHSSSPVFPLPLALAFFTYSFTFLHYFITFYQLQDYSLFCSSHSGESITTRWCCMFIEDKKQWRQFWRWNIFISHHMTYVFLLLTEIWWPNHIPHIKGAVIFFPLL